MIEKGFVFIMAWLMAASTVTSEPIILHYGLAGFGWLLYVVGKLYVTSAKYDTNDDGLSWDEVQKYIKKNWIAFLFNAMLLAIAVPYAQDWWPIITGLFDFSKGWEFTELVYVLAGSFILVVQILIDIVTWKLGTMKK